MSFEVNGLKEFKARLEDLKPATQLALVRGLNRAAAKVKTASSKLIRQEVRLPAKYVNDNMTVRKATRSNPEARIQARMRATRLARFGAKQAMRRAPNAKGDPLRGIPAGKKQGGVRVAVNRSSSPRKAPGFFLIPLRNAGVMGVFKRTGPGRRDIEHLYGRSVDQVFRTVRDEVPADRILEEETQKQVQQAINRKVKHG